MIARIGIAEALASIFFTGVLITQVKFQQHLPPLPLKN
jgi:hypothetical protein